MRGMVVVIAVVLLAACSSGKHEATSPALSTTTLAPTSTSTSSPASSTTTTAPTTTVPSSTTTTTVATPGSARITGFSYVGSSPVECNAPTMIEMKWTTAGASSVDLFIDGSARFARYPNGSQDELLPLACDGRSHTYKLVATASDGTTTKSINVTTKKTA